MFIKLELRLLVAALAAQRSDNPTVLWAPWRALFEETLRLARLIDLSLAAWFM